ncbi:uncharacterized protein F4817DRAFT_364830 [Daldinia loculata]|uniref:uncharacterized protein n=1 Tax=Daldinia loculata TaxID=103429 RepID=UPI0020C45681|nr:uncharacterized protein F4817DRAFT_364830 [Daldinia loculata]KAI1651919.1 hypothetical protein F4817DRAFT_364830 [Daldinia loculata]
MPHDHPYATVDQNEDAHASDPADEISISEEKQHLCRKTCAFRPSLTYFLVSGALLFLSFISGSVLHPVSLSNFNTIDRPHSQDQDGPRKFVPILPLETKTFEFNRTFADDPSENVTAAWLSLIPKGQGVIRLPLRHEFDSTIYNIAAYHTLHCLYTLRESFFSFYDISTGSVTLDAAETAHMLKHGRHCIEYIRQALMCNPDLTLEPVAGGTGQLKQWGIQRQCQDFGELSEWAREMRASDNEGITR